MDTENDRAYVFLGVMGACNKSNDHGNLDGLK